MTADDLRAIMARRGLTQAQAGWMTGLSARHLRKIIAGGRYIPTYVEVILRAYDEGLLQPEWLVRVVRDPVP
jgi:hypothetical protein